MPPTGYEGQTSKLRRPPSHLWNPFLKRPRQRCANGSLGIRTPYVRHAVTALGGALPMPSRPGPTTSGLGLKVHGMTGSLRVKGTPHPTPRLSEGQTPSKQRRMQWPVRRLTETRAPLHLRTPERTPDGGSSRPGVPSNQPGTGPRRVPYATGCPQWHRPHGRDITRQLVRAQRPHEVCPTPCSSIRR